LLLKENAATQRMTATKLDVEVNSSAGKPPAAGVAGEGSAQSSGGALFGRLRRMLALVREIRRLPVVEVDLMLAKTEGNDPFFARIVREYYDYARRRHPKYLVIRRRSHGVAVCKLPPDFDAYYMSLESSARRNHKKAVREGCTFRRIQYNDHLEDIRKIWQSTDTRQGHMPQHMLRGEVGRVNDPPSKTHFHDYPYYGVFFEGQLIGYAGCMIAGNYCGVEQIYGHADHFTRGAVPQLFIGIAQDLYQSYPQVKYFCYDTFFGASETMRRFKKKFQFFPHRVYWKL
jgi:hypothetical protein